MIVVNRNLIIVILLGLILIITVGSSTAGPHMKKDQYGQDGDWSVNLSAAGMVKPEYEGSGNYVFLGFPIIDITWRNMFLSNLHNGLGAYLLDHNDMKFGLSIGYSLGRDEDISSDLEGLGDIAGGATTNLLFKWEFEDFSFNARYEQQVTGADTGFQTHIGLGYELQLGEKIILKPSVKTTYSSADYVEEYFSISPGQSARSGLSDYDASSGFKSLGFQTISIYNLNRHWGGLAMAGYERLLGDTADSPIVTDENQYYIGIGVSYMF